MATSAISLLIADVRKAATANLILTDVARQGPHREAAFEVAKLIGKLEQLDFEFQHIKWAQG